MIHKKALITGAGRGIGQSTCLTLAKNKNLIVQNLSRNNYN